MDTATAESELKEIKEWAEAGYPRAVRETPPTLTSPFALIGWFVIRPTVAAFEKVLQLFLPPKRVYTDEDIARFFETNDVRAIPYIISGCETGDAATILRFRTTTTRLLNALRAGSARFGDRTRDVMYRILMTGKPSDDEKLMLAIIDACRVTGEVSAIGYLEGLVRMRPRYPADTRVKLVAEECCEYLRKLKDKNKTHEALLRPAIADDDTLLRAAGHQITTPEHLLRSAESEET